MNIINRYILLMAIIFSLAYIDRPATQQYILSSSVIANGGSYSLNSSYHMTSTLGQAVIGITENSSNYAHLGFWYSLRSFVVGIEQPNDLIPQKFELHQNYPNPFNPITKIEYAIPKPSYVRIEVYNVLGQRIRTLVNEEKQPGYYTVDFDASSLATGFYIYRLEANGFQDIKKMVVTK